MPGQYSITTFFIIQDNESIFELILAHNNLGEGGVAIGNALGKSQMRDFIVFIYNRPLINRNTGQSLNDISEKNDTLRSLDLSWNHIRVIGAVGLAKGVQVMTVCFRFHLLQVDVLHSRIIENPTLFHLKVHPRN